MHARSLKVNFTGIYIKNILQQNMSKAKHATKKSKKNQQNMLIENKWNKLNLPQKQNGIFE